MNPSQLNTHTHTHTFFKPQFPTQNINFVPGTYKMNLSDDFMLLSEVFQFISDTQILIFNSWRVTIPR